MSVHAYSTLHRERFLTVAARLARGEAREDVYVEEYLAGRLEPIEILEYEPRLKALLSEASERQQQLDQEMLQRRPRRTLRYRLVLALANLLRV